MSEVVQKAEIEVDEEGATAAAATGLSSITTRSPKTACFKTTELFQPLLPIHRGSE